MSGRSLRGSERAARLLLGFGVLLEVAMVVLPSPAAAGEPPTGAERPAVGQPFTLPEPIVLAPQVEELALRYREVFRTLASGDRNAAVGRAAALEMEALAADPRNAIEWLSQADAFLLGSYLAARPDCALPLAQFYQRLVLAHATQRRYPLFQRALHVADGLLVRMRLASSSQDERRLTADAYSGFAADLLTIPAPTRAAEMLDLGLELAPEDVDGNVALSILLLRDRRPDDAESRLDRVLKKQPGHREARLRRALMRAGFSADGRTGQELEKLATAGESDWIALVAAQERARRLLATGDYDKSIAFLDRVLERFPADSSLRVTLAFASARSSRRAEAYLAAQSALATKAATGEGARRVFAELPIRLLREQAARAAAAAETRLASLAAALDSVPAFPAPLEPAAPGSAGAPDGAALAPTGLGR